MTQVIGNRLTGTSHVIAIAHAMKPKSNEGRGRNVEYQWPIEGQSLTLKELCELIPHVKSATIYTRLNKGARTFAALGKCPKQAMREAGMRRTKMALSSTSRAFLIKKEKAAHFAALRAGHKQL